MKKILESKTKIRFQDCDPFNHLNNAKYLDYFINQREDQIEEEYNLNIFNHLKKTGQCWVVGSNQIIYLKPAFLMEEIIVESKLIDYDEKSIRVEMKMFNKDKTQLKSLLWIRFIYFDAKSQKSAIQPEEFMSLFKDVEVPQLAKTFEERTIQIMKERKAN
jgi:acyl-CoA thioester hydrolase